MKPIKEIHQVQLCFDEVGREVEVLDVVIIDSESLCIEENPILNEEISKGDIIRVKKVFEIFYYIETIKKSDLAKLSWLLSKEIIESKELIKLKEQVKQFSGSYDQIFGGLLIINISKEFEIKIVEEMNKILKMMNT